MILEGIKEIQKLLPSVNLRLDSNRLDDFILRSQQWTVDNIIGADIESTLETPIAVDQTDTNAPVRRLVKRVIATRAYLYFGDEMNLQLGEAGMVVQNNDAVAAASSQRRDNLMASLQQRLDSDCDTLVGYLLKNSKANNTYQNWRGSEQFSYLTQAFMPTMAILRQNTSHPLAKDWQEFYDLQPKLSMSLQTTVAEYVSNDQIYALLELYRDNDILDTHRRALRFIRIAVLADVRGMRDNARHFAIEARQFMLRHQGDFADFVNSDRYTLPETNMDGGHIVNTL